MAMAFCKLFSSQTRPNAAYSPSKKGVSATLTQNVGLIAVTLDNVILLQTDEEHLWLWCDDAHTGFIVPRINIIDL